jgi:type IV pilus assembly protein PilC
MATLQTFAYRGRNPQGRIVKGRLDAASDRAVVGLIQAMGLSPISITPTVVGTGLRRDIAPSRFSKRVSLKDLAVMARQMATMVGSGLSLIRTLTILADQTENPTLAKSLNEVRLEVEGGSSLSDTMARQPKVYPPLLIHLMRAGEAGGFLERSLESVAATFEADVKLRSTIKSAMTYPVIVFIMAILAVAAMLIFIVPVFEGLFQQLGGQLPVPTQILVNLSHNMIWIGPLIVVLIVLGVAWWRRNGRRTEVRRVVDTWKLRVPVFGNLLRKVAIGRFCRNLATMIGSGVPILQSLSIVSETSGNWVIENAIAKVQDSVRAGSSIAAPLASQAIIPSMVSQMIAVGEDSGSLQLMLDKVADFYDTEVEATTASLTALIEPLMIAVIGVLVGGMIIALYLPMFTIYSQIHA